MPEVIRVVLVEDNLADAELFTRGLDGGFELVARFSSGEECLQRLATISPWPDLVLTDLRLLGMSGFELCENLLSRFGYLKVIGYTGDFRDEITDQAAKVGMRSVLRKNSTAENMRGVLWQIHCGDPTGALEAAMRRLGYYVELQEQLTPRQLEVLKQIHNPEKLIAENLQLSHSAVKQHKSELMRRTGCHSDKELMSYRFKQFGF
jgi:DNA-binding NarL/FixJ family response regulator